MREHDVASSDLIKGLKKELNELMVLASTISAGYSSLDLINKEENNMRRQSETLKMLEAIDACMHREFDGDSFKSATFEMSDGIYTITDDFAVIKTDNAGNVQELTVHFCKGGIYPEVSISGMPIKLYVLVMLAVDSSSFESIRVVWRLIIQ